MRTYFLKAHFSLGGIKASIQLSSQSNVLPIEATYVLLTVESFIDNTVMLKLEAKRKTLF